MTAPYTRKFEPREVTFHWTTTGWLDPNDLARISEDLARYAHDSLPGSAIAAITYNGTKLDITLRESS